jgi:2'-5' RNA ligase
MAARTGLALLLPDLEPVVDRWRMRYDPAAAQGMPAHVTVLYPWKPPSLIGPDDLSALAELCRCRSPIDLVFARFRTFEQTLWLDPQPSAPVLDLIEAVVTRWPDYLPFAGEFDDVVPHLTLADHTDPEQRTDVVDDVGARLPLRSCVRSLHLMRLEAGRWCMDTQFPFGAPRGSQSPD